MAPAGHIPSTMGALVLSGGGLAFWQIVPAAPLEDQGTGRRLVPQWGTGSPGLGGGGEESQLSEH